MTKIKMFDLQKAKRMANEAKNSTEFFDVFRRLAKEIDLDLEVYCGAMSSSGFEAAAQAHFLAADPWLGRLAHANIAPLVIHDVLDTVSTPITDDLVINVPRYENGYFYPPDGPGLGVELNEEIVSKLIPKGKSPTVVEAKVAQLV